MMLCIAIWSSRNEIVVIEGKALKIRKHPGECYDCLQTIRSYLWPPNNLQLLILFIDHQAGQFKD